MAIQAKIVVLAGDGVGPEVMIEAKRVLAKVAKKYGHTIDLDPKLIGGSAIDAYGVPIRDEDIKAAGEADAVLLGAVGGPKWDNPSATVRPEQGLLTIRKALGLYANLRPVSVYPALINASPLKPEIVNGVDFVFVRELTGGIYFGKPSERRQENGEWVAVDTLVYRDEIDRDWLETPRAAAGGARFTWVEHYPGNACLEQYRFGTIKADVAHVRLGWLDELIEGTLSGAIVDTTTLDVLRGVEEAIVLFGEEDYEPIRARVLDYPDALRRALRSSSART